jgi:broad specificity phosphatase PhoE
VPAFVDLLRHGETAGGTRYRGRTDDPLTPEGWQQMRTATARGEWDRIVTSPLQRCRAFAAELAATRGIDLEVDPRLQEMDFGSWEGRTAEELMAEDRDALLRFWADPVAHPPPGGETLAALSLRVLDAWADLASGGRGARVLVVSHGGPIRVILGHLSGIAPAALITIQVPHGSLTRAGANAPGAVAAQRA